MPLGSGLSHCVCRVNVTTITAELIAPYIRKSIVALDAAGFDVVGMVADGATENRRFFGSHLTVPLKEFFPAEAANPDYMVAMPHPCCSGGGSGGRRRRYIFSIPDPPHNNKKGANNCDKSGDGEGCTRYMTISDTSTEPPTICPVSTALLHKCWLYAEGDPTMDVIKVARNLTQAHFTRDAHSRPRMNVRIACQLLSKTMVTILEARS